MPSEIDRHEMRRLVEDGAQLVEVLPAEEYRTEHLPGAISLPLKELRRDTAERLLHRERPVVVYCADAQ
jgi:rhodanese-related sulfurtransferase